jgi:hypothetical protein
LSETDTQDAARIKPPGWLTSKAEAWRTVFVDPGEPVAGDAADEERVNAALFEALSLVHEGPAPGQGLVKVHIGEPTNVTRMRPAYARSSARFLKERGASGLAAGDTTVAYTGPRGHRQNPAGRASRYLELAREHGWSEDGPARLPFVVLDRPHTARPGVFEFSAQRELRHVDGVRRFRDFHLAGGFAASRFVVNHAHLTLHMLAGVAGCVKGVAMGLSSLAGKLRMHQSLLPRFDAAACTACGECVENCPEEALSLEEGSAVPVVWPDECIGCGECASVCRRCGVRLEGEDITDWTRGEDTLPLRMTDYMMGLMAGRWEGVLHVLHMYTVTELCDCVDVCQEPLVRRELGFLVGKNPFAIDLLASRMLGEALAEEGVGLERPVLESAERAAAYARETYGVLAETEVERIGARRAASRAPAGR